MKRLLTPILLLVFLFPTLAQGKTHFYKAEQGTDARLEIRVGPDGRSYTASFSSGTFKYNCKPAKLFSDGRLGMAECDDFNLGDKAANNDWTDIATQVIKGTLSKPYREASAATINGVSYELSSRFILFYPDGSPRKSEEAPRRADLKTVDRPRMVQAPSDTPSFRRMNLSTICASGLDGNLSNRDRLRWTNGDNLRWTYQLHRQEYVKEAKRRGISLSDCRKALGMTLEKTKVEPRSSKVPPAETSKGAGQRLRELKKLLEEGLITKEEAAVQRKEILKNL